MTTKTALVLRDSGLIVFCKVGSAPWKFGFPSDDPLFNGPWFTDADISERPDTVRAAMMWRRPIVEKGGTP